MARLLVSPDCDARKTCAVPDALMHARNPDLPPYILERRDKAYQTLDILVVLDRSRGFLTADERRLLMTTAARPAFDRVITGPRQYPAEDSAAGQKLPAPCGAVSPTPAA